LENKERLGKPLWNEQTANDFIPFCQSLEGVP